MIKESNHSSTYPLWLVAALIPVFGYFVTASFLHSQAQSVINFSLFAVTFFTLAYSLGIIFDSRGARWLAITLFVFSFTVTLLVAVISARLNLERPLYPHDGARQIEAAARALWAGRNPYAEDFTAVLPEAEVLHLIDGRTIPNPAMMHLVYLPAHVILAAIFQVPLESLLGWFDMRIINWLFFSLATGFLVWKIRQSEWQSQTFLLVFFFNPLFFPYMIEGRGEALLLALLILILFALERQSYAFSAVLVGLALAFRQTLWFFLPFIFLFVFNSLSSNFHDRENWRTIIFSWRSPLARWLVICGLVFLIFTLPFFLWSPRDFIADTILYPTGAIATSYPVSGFGMGAELYYFGLIKSATYPFPFWLPQVLVGLPLLVFLLRWQFKDNTLPRLLAAYAVWLGAYWLLSRFFHHNYLGFVSQILLLAWIWEGRNVNWQGTRNKEQGTRNKEQGTI